MLFYCAVHDVDAFFDTLPLPYYARHPKGHKYRHKLVARYLNPISQEYYDLDQLSRWARYDNHPINPSDVTDSFKFFSRIHSYLNVP